MLHVPVHVRHPGSEDTAIGVVDVSGHDLAKDVLAAVHDLLHKKGIADTFVALDMPTFRTSVVLSPSDGRELGTILAGIASMSPAEPSTKPMRFVVVADQKASFGGARRSRRPGRRSVSRSRSRSRSRRARSRRAHRTRSQSRVRSFSRLRA